MVQTVWPQHPQLKFSIKIPYQICELSCNFTVLKNIFEWFNEYNYEKIHTPGDHCIADCG